jgi:hypothetical protein
MRTPYTAPFATNRRSVIPPALSRGALEEKFERVKQRLLDQILDETPEPELWEPMLHAANEAAAIAWTTAFPLLVLPVLMEEKAQETRQWAQHQAVICQRSRHLAQWLAWGR